MAVTLLVLGLVIMGADLAAVDMRPLRTLGLGPSPLVGQAHVVAAVAGAVIWISGRRRFRWAAGLAVLLLGLGTLPLMSAYTQARLDRVPTTRFLTVQERASAERALGFPIFQQASSGRGHEAIVARGGDRARRLGEHLNDMGVLRTPDQPLWPNGV